ncbi:antibiotic biosynthesis monooxygenase family protein [Spirosoma endbachense]|uniref:Antibiotic biosynthesis monooxygenase n=1 Tax=Spirosoma endbachense TaxID=2666025 RepID=A0A6P1W7T7_9BACT|nr:antibiotic biosynthesis monooxygenase [Spirosoma endbachense]QHW00443.1 antibiotic biosynthesis monooxygenase [Spirosoma endbachense]
MITEHALITIQSGREAEFEMEFPNAKAVISQAKGFVDLHIQRDIEAENRYLLLIRWQTLEDHTIGFRQSDLFTEWRAIIGPFFASPPVVDHFTQL